MISHNKNHADHSSTSYVNTFGGHTAQTVQQHAVYLVLLRNHVTGLQACVYISSHHCKPIEESENATGQFYQRQPCPTVAALSRLCTERSLLCLTRHIVEATGLGVTN